MPGSTRFIAFTLMLLALLLVTACGADDDAATPTTAGGAPAATETPTPTATADREQAALDNTEWLLAGINGVDVDLQEPLTLSFNDGQAGGFSGCNDYGGTYTTTTDGEFAMPEIEQTDMACESGMDLEADYLTTLGNAAHYDVIEEQRLELSDASGETTLVFTSDTREALDGTAWEAVEIDGEEALAAARPTLGLRAGEVSGSTGCNQFGGNYTADNAGDIAFSELFWTERGCIEPDGVMEQEQAFLAALQSAASFELDAANSRLLIVDGAGQTRLIFTSAGI